MQNRIEVFKQMLEADSENTMVMFGLASAEPSASGCGVMASAPPGRAAR